MKLPVVASVALLASGTAFAAHPMPVHYEHKPAVGRSHLYEILDRNQNGFWGKADWFKRFTFSGEINTRAYLSNATPNLANRFSEGTSHEMWLADANLYVDVDVNRWTKGHIALTWNDFDPEATFAPEEVAGPAGSLPGNGFQGYGIVNDPATYRPRGGVNQHLDEGYVTFADLERTPVYLRFGREYTRFGMYERHPVTASMVQLLTQTQATVAEIGFVEYHGFNGSAWIHGSALPRYSPSAVNPSTNPVKIRNGGAQLGYQLIERDNYSAYADVAWMYNMADVNYIRFGLTSSPFPSFQTPVGAIFATVGGHYGQFDAKASFVTSLKKFNVADLAYKGAGADPLAWDVELGGSFDLYGVANRISAGYQMSDEAVNITVAGSGLPKHRVWGDWTANLMQNVCLGLEVVYDKAYSASDYNGGVQPVGSRSNSTSGILHLDVKLA